METRILRLAILLVLPVAALIKAEESGQTTEQGSVELRIGQGRIDYSSAEDRMRVEQWLETAVLEESQALEEREALNREAIELKKQRGKLLERNEALQKNTDQYLYQLEQIQGLDARINRLLSESGQKMIRVIELKKHIRKARTGLTEHQASE
jgi:predicted RNase H-like nuclease (RuvC/YqgF family)